MSKRTRIVATYRPNPDELLQCSLEIPADYPDSLGTARAEIGRAMRELMGDTILLYDKGERLHNLDDVIAEMGIDLDEDSGE